MTDNVLDLIDNVIGQYGDAMRWSPDVEPEQFKPGGIVPSASEIVAWECRFDEERRRVRAEAVEAEWPNPDRLFDLTALADYRYLTAEQRDRIHAWVEQHGLAPRDVPIDGILGYDEATNEWRIRIYRRRDGKLRLNPDRETVESYVVRRRARAPLPWPVISGRTGEDRA